LSGGPDRYADRGDHRLVLVAGGILLVGWCAFALTTAYVVPSVTLVSAALVGAALLIGGSIRIAGREGPG
jgi:hypothetical protein